MALGRGPISSAPISGLSLPFVDTSGGGGGIFELPTGRGKRERIHAERERLGIIPKAVAKVIEQVAERKVADPELVIERALHLALERKALAYRAYYAEALRQRIEAKREIEAKVALDIQQRQQEDEEVALVLLLH